MKNTRFILAVMIVLTCSLAQDQERLINFSLANEKLGRIIARLAHYRKTNILLPIDSKILTDTTVTFKLDHKISLDQAWQLLGTILNGAGYTLVPRGTVFAIKPVGTVLTDALPFYVNTPIDGLPRNDNVVRYLYYFQNINIADQNSGAKNDLETIIRDMISSGAGQDQGGIAGAAPTGPQPYLFLDKFNCLLLTGGSNLIKAIIAIIAKLDQIGFRESVEVIKLENADAKTVVDELSQLIPKENRDDMFRFPPPTNEKKSTSPSYFATSTRLVPIEMSNSIAIFGQRESVTLARNFIAQHFDKPIDAKRSILRHKKLEYLNASDLADVLNALLAQKSDSSQSTADTSSNKPLSSVKIVAEKESAGAQDSKTPQLNTQPTDQQGGVALTIDQGQQQGPIIGGNNLIIAANPRDWKILNTFIDTIDKPQLQVAIEVLLVDMSIKATNQLNSQLRRLNATAEKSTQALKWQAANMDNPILEYDGTSATPVNPPGIAANLMSIQHPEDATKTWDIASDTTPGSTVITFKDKYGVTGVMSMLRHLEGTKIIDRLFIVTQNNKQADVVSDTELWVLGSGEQGNTGATIQNYTDIHAKLQVNILPRISSPPDNINLEIYITADNFLAQQPGGLSFPRTARTIRTNANIRDHEVLVLAGIAQSKSSDSREGTPFLQRIPIIGTLFQAREQTKNETNLVAFIAPAILRPRATSRMDEFTKRQLNNVKGQFIETGRNFDMLKDPITRLFFGADCGPKYVKNIEHYARQSVLAAEQQTQNPATRQNTEIASVPTSEKSIIEKKELPIKNNHSRQEARKKAENLKRLVRGLEHKGKQSDASQVALS